MKKAIKFLRSKELSVNEDGLILSDLPDNEQGVYLVDTLEGLTSTDKGEYTIIGNQVTFQEY